ADGRPVIENAAMRELDGEPGLAGCEPARRALEGQAVRNAEIDVTRAPGDDRIAVVSAAPLRAPTGELESVVVAATDVTEQRRAVAKFKRIYESGVVAIVLSDCSGRITAANDAFLDLVGYTREDLEQGRIDGVELTPPEYRGLDALAIRE